MTVSERQLKANKKNAQKGGVKTSEGKAIVKHNALKHGLLAKEIVITVGEGAENPEEFSVLMQDLNTQLKPEGILEEMLVEKIAVAYWRLRRAYTYEVGLIRNELDHATDDYYDKTGWLDKERNKTDEEIDQETQQNAEEIKKWRKSASRLRNMRKNGKPLEVTYDLDDSWEWLCDKVSYLLPRTDDGKIAILGSQMLREFFNENLSWTDEEIWEALIDICQEKRQECENEISALDKEKKKNKLKLQVVKKLGNIPSKEELDRLLRYEGALERQFYKALNQLERLQRLRLGDAVPAPVEMNLDVNTD